MLVTATLDELVTVEGTTAETLPVSPVSPLSPLSPLGPFISPTLIQSSPDHTYKLPAIK